MKSLTCFVTSLVTLLAVTPAMAAQDGKSFSMRQARGSAAAMPEFEAIATAAARGSRVDSGMVHGIAAALPKADAEELKAWATAVWKSRFDVPEFKYAVLEAIIDRMAGVERTLAINMGMALTVLTERAGHDAATPRQKFEGRVVDLMSAWARREPRTAWLYVEKLYAEGSMEKAASKGLPERMTAAVLSRALQADRSFGVEKMHALPPAQVARVLASFAPLMSSDEDLDFVLNELKPLTGTDRLWPLTRCAERLYESVSPERAATFIATHAASDKGKAEMVLCTVDGNLGPARLAEAQPHLKWLRENTPEPHVGDSLGCTYARLAFFEYDEARAAVIALPPSQRDAAVVAFIERTAAGMRHGKESFAMIPLMKDKAARCRALKTLFDSWSFFHRDEALAAIEHATDLGADERALVRGIVQSRN